MFARLFRHSLSFILFGILSQASPSFADADLSLKDVQKMFYGEDYRKPSAESLLGQYLARTHAATRLQKFWNAPLNNVPERVRGPERLVVSVSPETFPVFRELFHSKHFFYLLNEHGNFAAFEGLMSDYTETGWLAHVLNTPFEYLDHNNLSQSKHITLPRLAIPILLDSYEGDRARLYFELARRVVAQLNRDHERQPSPRDISRKPWYLEDKRGNPYTLKGPWSDGCSSWITNMPIGRELVDEYFVASGDMGDNPIHSPLHPYKVPKGFDADTDRLIQQVWTVPGHKQLGEILEPGANRRGEFDNTGWTTFNALGTITPERIPVVFYFVQDAQKQIEPDFKFMIDMHGAF